MSRTTKTSKHDEHINTSGTKEQQLAELEEQMRANFRLIQLVTTMSNLNGPHASLVMGGLAPHSTALLTPPISSMGNPNIVATVDKPKDKPVIDDTRKRALQSSEILEVACMARRSDGKQCTKPKHTRADSNTEYCNVHQTRRVYGRIDEPLPKGIPLRSTKKPTSDMLAPRKVGNKKKSGKPSRPSNILRLGENTATTSKTKSGNAEQKRVPKKRGRKRKHPVDPKFNDPAYVVMWPEIISGQKCLVDRYDRVFTYNPKAPIFLGKKTVDNQLLPTLNFNNTTQNTKKPL